MQIFRGKKLGYNRYIFIAIVALIYTALYAKTQILERGHVKYLTSDLILSYEFSFVLFLALSFSRFVFAFFTPIIFLVSCGASYFIAAYKVKIDERSIALVFETPTGIMGDFFTHSLIYNLVAALVIAVVIIASYLKFDRAKANDVKIAVVTIAFVIFAICFSNSANQYMPYNIISAGIKYTKLKLNITETYDVASANSRMLEGNDDLIMVLILGESARADHISFNGYPRQTTPKLALYQNLVNFSNAWSCSNLTIESKPCLLTRAQYDNFRIVNETSFISLFRKLNFDTVWFDHPNIYESTFLHLKLVDIMSEANRVVSKGYRYDTDYLGLVQEYLAEKNSKSLIVIDTKGSHWPYDNQSQEKQWYPICNIVGNRYNGVAQMNEMSECPPQALINSYDNSLLAVDTHVASIIEILKNKNALLIYVSDHGESLGEDGFYLHGQTSDSDLRPEQFHVAMIAWASDEYIKRNGQKFANIKNHSDLFIRHNSIFHSMLDCSGIESDVLDKALSICSE